MMRGLIIVFVAVLLSACGTGQFGSSYRAYVDPRLSNDLQSLPEEGEPAVIRSSDLDRDVRFYRENNYIVVGESAFNGFRESEGNAARQAKEVGATHVVIAAQYTDTQSHIAYDYQNFYRTYYVRDVVHVDGRPVVTRRAVTVRDTVTVPYQRYYDNYDQWAVFLAKSNRMPGLGLILRDLTGQERATFNRNTGAYVDVVLSNSPAFLADIVAGDVLVAVNNTKVNDINHAHSLISGLETEGQDITLTVIKDGKQVNISFGVVEANVTAGEAGEPTLSPEILPSQSTSPEVNEDSDWINPDTIQNNNENPPAANTPSVVF